MGRSLFLLVSLALVCCTSTSVVLPYIAQVESVRPEIRGLIIQGTSGGGGELEIRNQTTQEVTILDEQGSAYVSLTPDGVFELLGETWVNTKNTSEYYCHDPRIVYLGPEPSNRFPQIMKKWTITGKIGQQIFKVDGITSYSPNGNINFSNTLIIIGIAFISLISIIFFVLLLFIIRKKQG